MVAFRTFRQIHIRSVCSTVGIKMSFLVTNVSLSDIFNKLPSGRANLTETTDGPTNWAELLGGGLGGVLTLALLVALVALAIFRPEAFDRVIEALRQLMATANSFASSLRRQNPPSPPSGGRPRNLTDDEVLEMQARNCRSLAAEETKNAARVPRETEWV